MDVDLPDVLAEVTAQFARYEAALVSNDVAVLDELFRADKRTLRYGVGENLYGYDEIMAFRAARSPVGLGRKTAKTVITTYGRDTAVASTLFYREQLAGKVGRQMQTWVRFPEGWRIVAAHVSIINEPQDREGMSLDDLPAARRPRPHARAGGGQPHRPRLSRRPARSRAPKNCACNSPTRSCAARCRRAPHLTRPRSRSASMCRARRCARRCASSRPRAWSTRGRIAARWWRGRRSTG